MFGGRGEVGSILPGILHPLVPHSLNLPAGCTDSVLCVVLLSVRDSGAQHNIQTLIAGQKDFFVKLFITPVEFTVHNMDRKEPADICGLNVNTEVQLWKFPLVIIMYESKISIYCLFI